MGGENTACQFYSPAYWDSLLSKVESFFPFSPLFIWRSFLFSITIVLFFPLTVNLISEVKILGISEVLMGTSFLVSSDFLMDA